MPQMKCRGETKNICLHSKSSFGVFDEAKLDFEYHQNTHKYSSLNEYSTYRIPPPFMGQVLHKSCNASNGTVCLRPITVVPACPTPRGLALSTVPFCGGET